MRKPDPNLTPAEWELMEVIWKRGDAPSIREVQETAYPNGEKAYTTVQTIMNILVKKGYLSRKKIGLVNFYTPLKSRKQVVDKEMDQVVDRVFQGSVPALANHLLDSRNLDLDEIEKIRKLLKEKETELKNK